MSKVIGYAELHAPKDENVILKFFRLLMDKLEG